jgi:hypothetical protein
LRVRPAHRFKSILEGEASSPSRIDSNWHPGYVESSFYERSQLCRSEPFITHNAFSFHCDIVLVLDGYLRDRSMHPF